MTLSTIARRVAGNLAGLLLSLAFAWLVFSGLQEHQIIAAAVTVLGSAGIWTAIDYHLDRRRRPIRSSTLMMRVVEDRGTWFELEDLQDGRTTRVLLEGAARADFQMIAASAGVAPKRADILAFAKVLEHGAGLADAYGLTREIDTRAVLEALETVRGIVRGLAVDAEAMAVAHSESQGLELLRRSDAVSKAAHELGTAAFLLHAKALAARENLILQNRDR